MSEQPTGTAARPPRGSEPKILGMPRTAVLVGAAVFIGAVVWFLMKRRSSSAAAPAAAPGECTDASGQPVPCAEGGGIDYSGQLSTIQTELESLLAAGGVPATGGGGQIQPGGTDSHGPPTIGGGGGTTTTVRAPAAPGGLRASKVTPSSVTLAWTPSAGATSYIVRVTYQSKLVKEQAAGQATTATVSGLGADHTYGLHVIAENSAGRSPESSISVKTK